MYKNLTVHGYRGFSRPQKISFAVPDPDSGNLGLTMIVGGNNSGKSTIIEAMSLFSPHAQLTIQPKRRNLKVGYVDIVAEFKDGEISHLSNQHFPDSILEFVPPESKDIGNNLGPIIKIPSRRHFSEFFQNTADIVDGLATNITTNRGDQLSRIGSILRTIRANESLRERLNELLREITGVDLLWRIEVSNSDIHSHFIQFEFQNGTHTSEGLGEGLLSLFVILLPFVEEKKFDIIAIDEPELSLHPALQRRLFKKIIEFSKTRQIIINTHSPYFVEIGLVNQGAKILRVFKNSEHEIEIGELQKATAKSLRNNISTNSRHPQYFGLDMKEILFAEDGVVLTEGQEDVVCFRRGLDIIEKDIPGDFFGWGAGGTGNIPKVCQLLTDLKFKSVIGVFDNEPAADVIKQTCIKDFPDYKFLSLPTPDIRDKSVDRRDKQEKAKDYEQIEGLFDEDLKFKEKYRDTFEDLISLISNALTSNELQEERTIVVKEETNSSEAYFIEEVSDIKGQ